LGRGKACQSACTLVTAFVPPERICFGPYAWLGFHQATYVENGKVAARASQWMYDKYPPEIKFWIEGKGGGGPAVAFAAKAATTTIPIVFSIAEDPVRLGLGKPASFRTHNRVATLEAAKAEFEASWRQWMAWAKLGEAP
jgi:hypothetical protein